MSKNKEEKKEKSAIITSQIMAIDETIKKLEKSYTSKKLLLEKQLDGYNGQLIRLQKILEDKKPDEHIVEAKEGYAELKDTGNRAPSPIHNNLKTDIQDIKQVIKEVEGELKTDDKDHEEMLKKLRKQKSEKESELIELIKSGGRKTRRRRNLSSREKRTRRSRKTKMTRRK
jgi:hypothetical protein